MQIFKNKTITFKRRIQIRHNRYVSRSHWRSARIIFGAEISTNISEMRWTGLRLGFVYFSAIGLHCSSDSTVQWKLVFPIRLFSTDFVKFMLVNRSRHITGEEKLFRIFYAKT